MVFKSLFPLVALLAAAPLQVWAAIGPVANLNVVNANVSPDGFSRSAAIAQSDAGDVGPLITANVGDTLELNVINSLTEHSMNVTTSIHWHGLIQRGSTWSDGAAFVSQCPIASGNSFEYKFQAASAGTFWYHSHVRTQYCEGLRGPIVVYDPNDAYKSSYDVDNESTVITLADWYHTAGAADSPANPPLSTLINGKGRFSGGTAVDLAVISVEAGKRYRLRIVSMSCDPNYKFSIDSHTMTVIEVDGTLHKPLVVDQIQIFAGQRYSVILNANQTVGNYWIRALPNAGTTSFTGGLNSAILRYSGAATTEPAAVTAPTATAALSESSLIPLVDPGAPGTHTRGAADSNVNLALGFNAGAFTVNGVSYTPPTVPVLLQILSGKFTAAQLLPSGSVYTLPRNAAVEISIPAGTAPGGPHPIHMHGHVFDVVRVAGSTTYNYDTPLRRDVVSVGGSSDNVTIRFTTDNPGPWILHCHIDRHLLEGLAIVFAEDAADTSLSNPVPASWSELCPIYNALAAADQ